MGIGCVKMRRRPGCVWGLPLDLFPQTPPNFFLPTQAVRTIAHPAGESAPDPHLTQSSAVRCGLPFPGIAFGLLTPSLDATSSLLKFLNLFEKPRPKFLASRVFCSRCSVAFFPGTPHVCSGWPPCLFRASRSGATLGSPFSFLICKLSAPLPKYFSLPPVSRPF